MEPLFSTDRGTGPPVVLLHGQPGSGASWDPLSRLLVDEFRVLAPDRPGYGATAGEARGLADNADVVAAFIGDRRAGPATVVAHSWAGGVAVLLAARHRSTVKSLVLVGAACTPDSLNAIDRWLNAPVLGNALTVAGLVGIGEVLPRIRRLSGYAPSRYRERMAATLPDENVIGRRWGALGRNKRSFMIEQQAIVAELPTVTALLGGLDLPVAVVSGEWDIVVPPRAAVSLARAVPGAELTLLPRAGHFVARDDPHGLADVIRRSVRSGPDRTGAGR
jgi:pimeloyl-ACP methyl ester carboxylesterase